MVGIHLLAVADPPSYDPATVTPEERSYLDEVAAWFADAGGYEHEQMTPAAAVTRILRRAGAATSGAGLIRPLWRSRSSRQPGAC